MSNLMLFHKKETEVAIIYLGKMSDCIKEESILVSMRENLSSWFANNKGADQSAHLRSLISTFVIRSLESIISKLATSEILIF